MPGPIKNRHRLKLTDDGLHIADSILWLESAHNQGLSFVSEVVTAHLKAQEIIATEETVKLLEDFGNKPHALICQYFRPFTLGNLKIELLPSGHVLGGSLLLVDLPSGERILYAPKVGTIPRLTCHTVHAKKAHTLLVGVDRDKDKVTEEFDRLIDYIAETHNNDVNVHLYADFPGIAQEIAAHLGQRKVSVVAHGKTWKTFKSYEALGYPPGMFYRYSQRKKRSCVHILPRAAFSEGRISGEQETILVSSQNSRFSDYGEQEPKIKYFDLSLAASYTEIESFIDAVSPKELLFTGLHARRACKLWAHKAAAVGTLDRNDQPALF